MSGTRTAAVGVPGGDRQTLATLRMMQEIVHRSLFNPDVVETAVGIVRSINGRDTVAMHGAIRSWMATHVAFLPDPAIEGDVLRTPDYALREIATYGAARIDCDDTSMLGATLGKAVGMSARFVVLGFPDYRHVYSELLTADGWLDLDVTEPLYRQRQYRPLATRTLHIMV